MSRNYDKTAMGGNGDRFRTTCWDFLEAARTEDESQKKIVLSILLNSYWKPVYCYLRRKGHSNESAKDLTQDFFLEVVLCKDFLSVVDKAKGRFRTFLLSALDNFTANVYHRENARKRHPQGDLVSLNAFEHADNYTIASDILPEDAFNYIWASELLDNVLKKVEIECCDTGKEIHWRIFNDKVLSPLFDRQGQLSLTEICARYGVESPAKASNMIVTVKRRFNAIMKQTIRMHVDTDSQVDEEFSELINILSKNRAR